MWTIHFWTDDSIGLSLEFETRFSYLIFHLYFVSSYTNIVYLNETMKYIRLLLSFCNHTEFFISYYERIRFELVLAVRIHGVISEIVQNIYLTQKYPFLFEKEMISSRWKQHFCVPQKQWLNFSTKWTIKQMPTANFLKKGLMWCEVHPNSHNIHIKI